MYLYLMSLFLLFLILNIMPKWFVLYCKAILNIIYPTHSSLTSLFVPPTIQTVPHTIFPEFLFPSISTSYLSLCCSKYHATLSCEVWGSLFNPCRINEKRMEMEVICVWLLMLQELNGVDKCLLLNDKPMPLNK